MRRGIIIQFLFGRCIISKLHFLRIRTRLGPILKTLRHSSVVRAPLSWSVLWCSVRL